MKQREVTIFISTQDIQNMLGCTKEEANEIWDKIDEEHDINEILKQDAKLSFNFMLHQYKLRNQ